MLVKFGVRRLKVIIRLRDFDFLPMGLILRPMGTPSAAWMLMPAALRTLTLEWLHLAHLFCDALNRSISLLRLLWHIWLRQLGHGGGNSSCRCTSSFSNCCLLIPLRCIVPRGAGKWLIYGSRNRRLRRTCDRDCRLDTTAPWTSRRCPSRAGRRRSIRSWHRGRGGLSSRSSRRLDGLGYRRFGFNRWGWGDLSGCSWSRCRMPAGRLT